MSRKRLLVTIILLIAIGSICALLYTRHFNTAATAPNGEALSQDAYVWQRAWTPAISRAVAAESPRVRRFVVLAAEISLARDDAGVSEFHPDYTALPTTARNIGIAIRIGPLPGGSGAAMNPQSIQTQIIRDTAGRAVTAARQAGMNVVEVQIDFDCGESKLAGYINWVRAIRPAVSPSPLVITALPSWLKHSEFADLVREAGPYVLQVHSLHRPTGPDGPMSIFDAGEARQAVLEAATIGIPFRVALPTYSYLAGFSREGKLLGLSAEGPAVTWPPDSILRTMRPDSDALADLVREWSTRHPAMMSGIIWYRLPVSNDTMNWHAATWHAVMEGRRPIAAVHAETVQSKPGLWDIFLVNSGEADAPLQYDVTQRWDSGEMIAAEGIGGFERIDAGTDDVTFRAQATPVGRWIAPGERIAIGWLRLNSDKEVRVNVSPIPHREFH